MALSLMRVGKLVTIAHSLIVIFAGKSTANFRGFRHRLTSSSLIRAREPSIQELQSRQKDFYWWVEFLWGVPRVGLRIWRDRP